MKNKLEDVRKMQKLIDLFLNDPNTITLALLTDDELSKKQGLRNLSSHQGTTEEIKAESTFEKKEGRQKAIIKDWEIYCLKTPKHTFLLTATISNEFAALLKAGFKEFGFVQNLTKVTLEAKYKNLLDDNRPEYKLFSEMIYRDGGRSQSMDQSKDPYYDEHSAITVSDWEEEKEKEKLLFQLSINDRPQCSFPSALEYKGNRYSVNTAEATKAFSVGFYAIDKNDVQYYTPLCTWALSYNLYESDKSKEEEFVYNILVEEKFTTLIDFLTSDTPCNKPNDSRICLVLGGDKPEYVLTAEKGKMTPAGTTTISDDDRPLKLSTPTKSTAYPGFFSCQNSTWQPANKTIQQEEYKDCKPSPSSSA